MRCEADAELVANTSRRLAMFVERAGAVTVRFGDQTAEDIRCLLRQFSCFAPHLKR